MLQQQNEKRMNVTKNYVTRFEDEEKENDN